MKEFCMVNLLSFLTEIPSNSGSNFLEISPDPLIESYTEGSFFANLLLEYE